VCDKKLDQDDLFQEYHLQYREDGSESNRKLQATLNRMTLPVEEPLMGKIRNIFSVAVGRYTKSAQEQRDAFKKAQAIWEEAAQGILYV